MPCATQALQAVQNQLPSPSIPSGHREGRLEDAEYQRRLAEKVGKRKAQDYTIDVDDDANFVTASAAGAFNTLAVAAVTLIVVVFVVGQIDDAMSMDEEAEFYESYETVIGTTGSAFDLAAVALIVLVASVILWYVSGFGGNGGDRLS